MAEKIAAINVGVLTNNDVYGYLNDVEHQIEDTFSTRPDFIAPFIAAQNEFEEALKGSEMAYSTAELAAADHEADLAWCGLNNYLKAMILHPKSEKRDAAEKIYQVFSRYENPTALSYATEYGIMERLLADLKQIPSETLKAADVTDWLNDLDLKCTNFVQMYSLRVQDKASKITGAIKNARLNAINSYRDMVKMANALLLISPTDELSRFASHLNELISVKQTAIKSKKTKAVNASNGSNSGVEIIENPDGSISGIIE